MKVWHDEATHESDPDEEDFSVFEKLEEDWGFSGSSLEKEEREPFRNQ